MPNLSYKNHVLEKENYFWVNNGRSIIFLQENEAKRTSETSHLLLLSSGLWVTGNQTPAVSGISHGNAQPGTDLLVHTDSSFSTTPNRFMDLFALSLKAISSAAERGREDVCPRGRT